MTNSFYDVKQKKKVVARVNYKCSFDTPSGKRYAFIGSGESGNKMYKFITESEYKKAKVKVLTK